jgi:hypothetical protein
MGKTVESYSIALEEEISRWKGFARALRKDDREAFEEMMETYRSYAYECSNATQSIVFEPMVMSIIIAQRERISQIGKELNAIKPETSSQLAEKETIQNPALVAVYYKKKKLGGEQTRLS